MTGTLFEVEHKCPGPWCRYCEARTGVDAAEAAIESTVTDPEWTMRAVDWLNRLGPYVVITADELTRDIGLPVGSGNQVGAIFRKWHTARIIEPVGFTTSGRASNHGRIIREWKTL